MTLQVKSLGTLSFQDAKGRERRPQTRKTAALAVYLAMHPGKRFARDAIAGLLWGDKNDSNARHSLSQAISDLRRVFGDDVIHGDSQLVWIPAGAADVDALHLAQMALGPSTRETLDAVERLYRGDFLDGFDMIQEEFECWAMTERERLRRLALGSMAELLSIKMRTTELATAASTARNILTYNPFEEKAHRAIMRCYASQGSSRLASDYFTSLKTSLRHELGVEPEAATLELYRDILRGSGSLSADRILTDYAFLLEQLPYAVVVTNTANRIVGWNHIAEEIFGFSKQEMCGQSPTVVYNQPDKDSILADQILTKAIAVGRWTGEVALKTKDGRIRRQRRVVTPLFGREGEFVGAFGHGVLV